MPMRLDLRAQLRCGHQRLGSQRISCSVPKRTFRLNRIRLQQPYAKEDRYRDNHSHWQQRVAEKIEHRKEYLSGKWRQTSLAHGIHAGQDALKDGWRSTEIGRTVDKEAEVLIEKWRQADKEELKKWQKNINAGVTWTSIFGPAIGGLAFAAFGLMWTVIVWGTTIVVSIPYALFRGKFIDSTALSAALQLALVQFVTLFCYAAYKGYEWTMTRELTEEEKQRWQEEQELQQLHVDELNDFDLRLTSERQNSLRRSIQSSDKYR